jgi:hypothetical protein
MRYKLLAGGVGTDKPPIVQIELKDDIKKRIGKSPDEAEAIMLAWLQDSSSEWGEVVQVEPIKSRWVE